MKYTGEEKLKRNYSTYDRYHRSFDNIIKY